jgi:hypothetical protein
MLNLPIWSVTEHIQTVDAIDSHSSEPGTALVFSSADKLFKFMNANLGGEWKMAMASDRDGLIILIADFHRMDVGTLRMNPETDGNGGEEFTLADLMALAESLRKDAK